MSHDKTNLGYVFLHAGNVIDRAEAALERISATRAERHEQFIKNVMAPRPRFFGGMTKGLTRREALDAIKADEWLRHELWYLTDDFESPKQVSLKTLINVAHGLLGGGDPSMQISIEAADWLYPDPS